MAEHDRWVVQHPDGGWAVVKEGRERVSDLLPTQEEAIARGHEIVRNLGGGELVIKGVDGKIREKLTVAGGSPDDAASSSSVSASDDARDAAAARPGFFQRLFGRRSR